MLKILFVTIALISSLLVARAGDVDSEYKSISEFISVESGNTELICALVDKETLASLLKRKSYFVIAVKSYQANLSGSSGFKVSLVDSGGNSLSVTRFGIFPGESFSVEDEQNYHRFSVTLPQDLESLTKNNEWCFEIELEPFSEDQIYTDTKAELRLEISHILNKTVEKSCGR